MTNDEVTVTVLRERLHDYSAVAYTQVSGLMLSGIFALGAIALLDILRNPDHRVLRLSFWIMATSGEILAAMIQMQRPLLMRRSGVEEVPTLVWRGLVSLLVYATIAPQSGGADGWRYGYSLGILFLLANWVLNWEFKRALNQQRLAPEVSALVDRLLKSQLTLDRRYPVILAVLGALLALTALAPRDWLFVEWVALTYNVVATLMLCAIGVQIQRAWIDFENAITNQTEPR